MSAGIRSGVNWMRLNSSFKHPGQRARSSASWPDPGTPTSRQCPRANIAASSSSITWSCPMMTLCSSLSSDALTAPNFCKNWAACSGPIGGTADCWVVGEFTLAKENSGERLEDSQYTSVYRSGTPELKPERSDGMNVTISDPKVIEYLRTAVESGQFPSVAEAIECALAMFQLDDSIELEVDEELRAKIQVGVDQLDRGEFSIFDSDQIWKEAADELRRKS